MTKIRYLQMAIFQKNITSKMDENGLKYMSRTNLHFDIGLGWLVHEKNHRGKIEIFDPSWSPTGIKGATDQILP